MRNHSGNDDAESEDRSRTLKDDEGAGGTGRRGSGNLTEGDGFEVATDHDPPSGDRLPTNGGPDETVDRGATTGSDSD